MNSAIVIWCPVQDKALEGLDLGDSFVIDGWTREQWIADIAQCTPSEFERWCGCYVEVFKGFQIFRKRKIDLIRYRHVLRAEAATQLRPTRDLCNEINSIRTSMLTSCYSEVVKEEDLNELYKAKSAFEDYKDDDEATIEILSNKYSDEEQLFFRRIEDRIANQDLDALLIFENSDGAEESKG